jgi:hypothetical protein
MEAEALPLINILDLKEDIPQRIAPPAPAVSYSGHKHGIDIHVVRNGEHSVSPLQLTALWGIASASTPEPASQCTCRVAHLQETDATV